MQNLFSTFDASREIIFSFNWIGVFYFIFFIDRYFFGKSQLMELLNWVRGILVLEIKLTFGEKGQGGICLFFLGIFFFIASRNLGGLLPYLFTPSRHISYALFLSIPIWLGSQVWGWLTNFNKIALHLVPSSTPSLLIPFLVLIERLRSVIRPLTLAIRLVANIVAGHLLLCLLGGRFSPTSPLTVSLVIILLSLELGVALIQAYVFILLSSLYREEVRVNPSEH